MKAFYQLIRHDGNRELFRAVEMSIIAMSNGYPFHIHAQGLRGTGKTSILRAAKDILPPIVRIKNCIYNCHPKAPHCPEHRNLSPAAIADIGTELVPCPFLEISHSAKLGTVVGSIDLVKLTDKNDPAAALLPGTIPKAHRGVIFVDEINRLADTSPEIADVLLDLMGTKPGRVQLEETGLPTVELPVSVAVWAASNPDEDPGPLVQIRKQLADRFDVAVNMGRPSDYRDVIAILDQKAKSSLNLKAKEVAVAGKLNDVVSENAIKNVFASIYIDFGLESLRAVESMEVAASLSALISGRKAIILDDIATTIPLVLSHRVDNGTIVGILKYLDSFKLANQGVQAAKPLTERNKAEENLNFEETKNANWWQQLWNAWKNISKLNRFTPKPIMNSPLPKPDSDKQSSQPLQDSINKQGRTDNDFLNVSGKSQQTCAKSNIADPMTTKLSAPPGKAVPLSNLPIEEFVASEDK